MTFFVIYRCNFKVIKVAFVLGNCFLFGGKLAIVLGTLKVESFAGIKFRGDKLSRTPRAKIKFRGYKLSRLQGILVKFSYFNAIFGGFLSNISRTFRKVRFRGY